MKKLYDIGLAEPGSRLADNVILGELLARCSAWQLMMRVTHLAMAQGKTLTYHGAPFDVTRLEVSADRQGRADNDFYAPVTLGQLYPEK